MELNTEIWGKTLIDSKGKDVYYPLIGHMLDTVLTSKILFKNWLKEDLRESLGKQFRGIDRAESFISLAAGLHDIGKCYPVFQGALLNSRGLISHSTQKDRLEKSGLSFPDLSNEDTKTLVRKKLQRHEKVGFWILSDRNARTNNDVSDSWLQVCALGHHGSFGVSFGSKMETPRQKDLLDSWVDAGWSSQISLHIKKVEEASGITLDEANAMRVAPEIVMLISGLIVLSDRLASNELSVKDSYERVIRGEISFLEVEEYCENRYDFLENLASVEIGFSKGITKESILGDFKPRGVQDLVPREKGLWIAMAPTGAGKTEAALLRHSQKSENLIFLLPTRSTTDALFSRLQKIYDKSESSTVGTLAHGDAYLNDFYAISKGVDHNDDHDSCGSGIIPAKLTNAGAKLSAPVTVGTIDQMVMAGLPLKWSHLRLLTLANSHIVIDEAHLLDPYQVTLIKQLLGFLGKLETRVTILSATMTTKLKRELARSYTGDRRLETKAEFPSQEIFPQIKGSSFNVSEYKIKVDFKNSTNPIDTHVDWAVERITENPKARLGIFVNTINRCQEIASKLQKELPDVKIVCLHSRMLGKHRKQVVDELIEACGTSGGEQERVILIGTQVIEMSLDIDLDLVSTDICPAPSFVQRIGRAWRDKSAEAFEKRSLRINTKKYENLTVHVVSQEIPDNKTNPFLPYQKSVIRRTIDYLSNRNTINFPDDIQEFVEKATIDFEFYGLSDDLEEQDEYTKEIYEKMAAGNIESKISDSIDEYVPIKSWSILTSEKLDDETATRLILENFPPLIIESSNKDIQNLGAVPLGSSVKNMEDYKLKSASVSVNFKISKILSEEGINACKAGNRIFAYSGPLPSQLRYDKLLGLVII